MTHLTPMEINEIYEWLDVPNLPRCGENGEWVPTLDEIQNKILPYVENAEKDYSAKGQRKARSLIAFLCWISEAGWDMEPGAAQAINDFVTKRMDHSDEEYSECDSLFDML